MQEVISDYARSPDGLDYCVLIVYQVHSNCVLVVVYLGPTMYTAN